MILTKEMEDNFVRYAHHQRQKGEHVWDRDYFDDVIVTYAHKGKYKEKCFSFKRIKSENTGKNGTRHFTWTVNTGCSDLVELLESKVKKHNLEQVVTKAQASVLGNTDDFSLGAMFAFETILKLLKEDKV